MTCTPSLRPAWSEWPTNVTFRDATGVIGPPWLTAEDRPKAAPRQEAPGLAGAAAALTAAVRQWLLTLPMAYQDALLALADPTRRSILQRLRRGPLAVGKIAAHLPVSRPAVSQHLRVLEGARLVNVRRDGTRRLYAIEAAGLEELRRYLEGVWDDVLRSFGREAAAAARARRRRRR